VTSPISYRGVSLHALMKRRGQVALAAPFLLDTVPCSALPRVAHGVGQPPTMLVDGYTPVADPTGPWGAIPDLFQLRRLSLADSTNPPFPVRIFQVRVPRGNVLLPVERSR
jgi:hypothetical protein